MLKQNVETLRTFEFNSFDSDNLYLDSDVSHAHSGPFEVDVDEEAFRSFFTAHGLDHRTITAEQLDVLRQLYGLDGADQALTDEQAEALRKIVRAKLALWDASTEAEKLLGRDVDSDGRFLHDFCASIDDPEQVNVLGKAELLAAFDLVARNEGGGTHDR